MTPTASTALPEQPSVVATGLRWRMVIASALLVLSIGLPWGHATTWSTVFHPGWHVAGPCRTVQTWDGWYESVCEPGVSGAAWTTRTADGNGTVPGAQHGGRFGIVAGLLLIAMAWRLRRPRLLWMAAVAVAVFTVLTAGLGFASAGSGAAWLAAALLGAPGRVRPSPGGAPSAG